MTFSARIGARLAAAARTILDAVRSPFVEVGAVCYFPRFDTPEELTDHYFRAAWYLPRDEQGCTRVTFASTSPPTRWPPGPCPANMAVPAHPPTHFRCISGLAVLVIAIVRADLVLVWRAGRWGNLIAALRRLGIRIVDVDTHSKTGREYVNYCNLVWLELTPAAARRAIILDQHGRFLEIASRLRREISDKAYVFGTGPSLNLAFDHDFANALKIACNTIVASEELLEHIAPHFITAADMVSHFGVSAYAGRFREDLLRALTPTGPVFVTTASLGALLLAHYPSLRDRVLLLDYRDRTPAFDLIEDFRAPAMESVLNSLMLPIAATFCRDITLVGCDGKAPAGSNEDFWPHAEEAHYQDLVDSGHVCHPTFDPERQNAGYARYNADVEATLTQGTARGLRYHCLFPSNLPALAKSSASP